MMVFLDTGVLSILTHPGNQTEAMECKEWLKIILSRGAEVRVPEIADYELRRKLVHLDSSKAIGRLDDLGRLLGYVPLSTGAMRRAATFWADARSAGLPTAAPDALDGDVILAAQVVSVPRDGHDVVVATTNVKHIERFVPARLWRDVTAG